MRKILNLSIPDRILLPVIYPQSGGMIEMEFVKSLHDKIKFTPSEIEEYELQDRPNGTVVWNTSKAKDAKTEIELEEVEIQMLQRGIEKLDKEKKITLSMIDLVRRILDLSELPIC